MNTVLIAGATGVVGLAALEYFSTLPDWDVIALSRRVPEMPAGARFRHLALDLRSQEACQAAQAQLGPVTHLIYAALSEQPGLVAGWRDPALMQTNLAMLTNLIEALKGHSESLSHVTLLQGTKAYGAHVGLPMPVPAREDAARVVHDNFYWLQEDFLRSAADRDGFRWTIFRPQVVIGAAWGAAMNPLLALGAYAAIRREEGKPFAYPGGELQIGELTDAQLLTHAFHWAAITPSAAGQTFNITNGDVFAWREAWPAVADALGAELGDPEPHALAGYLSARSQLWDQVVKREGLAPLGLRQFLGESDYYADVLLRPDATSIGRPALLSTIKLRQAGFSDCRDSEACLRHWIAQLQERRLLPRRFGQR